MRHRLQNAALPEARLVGQLHRIEDSTGGDADRAQLRHRLVLRTLPRPAGDDLVHLGLTLQSGVRGFVARVADQVLAPDQLQQTWPMLGIGAAGQQVDVIVGAAGLARKDAAGRVIGGRPPRRRSTSARLGDEHAAAVVHHGILHRHLQPATLAGARAVEQRADDAERQQHASAGVADRRAGLDRPAVALAGDAHRTARGLRDRVERQALLIRAAVTEPFDLGIDDAAD